MADTAKNERTAGVSDAAVNKATGRTWAQWLRALDAAGARKMEHKDIAALVYEKHPEIGGWWSQMVTVGYEQARGMRDKHQKPDGYSVGASRTIATPVSHVFQAFKDGRRRSRWLPDAKLAIRKATPDKSLRITWADDGSSVNVNFYAKGPAKSQVAINHDKLASARSAKRMKKYWGERLDELKAQLQT